MADLSEDPQHARFPQGLYSAYRGRQRLPLRPDRHYDQPCRSDARSALGAAGCTNFGSRSPAWPHRAQSTMSVNGVSLILISIALAPACLAKEIRPAAGYTA